MRIDINDKVEEVATEYNIDAGYVEEIIRDAVEDMLITKDSDVNEYIEDEIEVRLYTGEIKKLDNGPLENLILKMNEKLKSFAEINLVGKNKLRLLGCIRTEEFMMEEIKLKPGNRSVVFEKANFNGTKKDYLDYISYFKYLGEMYMSDSEEKKLSAIIEYYKEKFKGVKEDGQKRSSSQKIS